MKLDKARSIALAKKIRAYRKRCWTNAFRAMRPSYYYVIGWADGVPHAWIETRRGRILDPTAASTRIADRRWSEWEQLLGRPGPVWFHRYVPHRRYTLKAILKMWETSRSLGADCFGLLATALPTAQQESR